MNISRRLMNVILLSFALLLVMAPEAYAGATPTGGEKLGDVLGRVTGNFAGTKNLLSLFAYLGGLFFAITGVFKFKDHVDSPNNNPLSAGVKRFLSGGMLFSAPYMTSVVRNTLTGGGAGTALGKTSRHAASTDGGMDQMIVDFVSNVAGPMETLLHVFVYIAGVILLLTGITRLTKTAQDGPRGPGGLGTIMTFLAAGAMFSSGHMMSSFSNSLFGQGGSVSTYANIGTNIIADNTDRDKIAAVVEALMAFVTLVGYIAFIRGWFVLKAFADGGGGNVSLAQALTFLFGGTVAINLGSFVNVLQQTVGVSGITFQ